MEYLKFYTAFVGGLCDHKLKNEICTRVVGPTLMAS